MDKKKKDRGIEKKDSGVEICFRILDKINSMLYQLKYGSNARKY